MLTLLVRWLSGGNADKKVHLVALSGCLSLLSPFLLHLEKRKMEMESISERRDATNKPVNMIASETGKSTQARLPQYITFIWGSEAFVSSKGPQ